MQKISRLLGGLFSLLILTGLAWALLNSQLILDQLRVWQFQPSDEIVALATNSGMSARGRFQFYATRPKLESSAEFNNKCRRAEAASPILGCYKQGEDIIHIYDVTDEKLDGVKEVTAAHEMLHAAWERLSATEKARLGGLLDIAYDKVKDDQLAKRMAYYDRTQPGSRHNELHSILGTEYADLGDELEKHYAKYFTSRTKVVSLHKKYNQVFEALESQSEQLNNKLSTQKTVIQQRKSAYDSAIVNLNNRIADFNQRAQQGDFNSQQQFYQERSTLQAEGQRLKTEREAIIALIEAYNQDVEKLNSLGKQAERLNQSLDSHRAVE